jgi:ribosomal protein L11 methyltransferase
MQKLSQNTYIEIAITAPSPSPASREAILNFFRSRGIVSGRIVTSLGKSLWKACFYTRSFREVARIKKYFPALKMRSACFAVKILGPSDWLDKWKLDYHIRPLGKKFMLVPEWEKSKRISGKRIPLYLDPGGAFGSGTHETTRLVVSIMESLVGRFKSVLDLGTGTGILSVAAAKLGACEVFGIDNDAQSVRMARYNFSLNRCAGGKFRRADLKTFRPQHAYDLVTANLLSKTLIEYQSVIRRSVKIGAHLIASGIHRNNLKVYLAGFRHPGLRCQKILNTRSWSAVLWRRVK